MATEFGAERPGSTISTRGTRLAEVGRVFPPEARAVLTRADAALETARRAVRGEAG